MPDRRITKPNLDSRPETCPGFSEIPVPYLLKRVSGT